jgi:SAM-dependent methyltransferase
MSFARRVAKNLVPPIFFKHERIGDRLAALLLRLLASQSLETLRYEQFREQVEKTPEISALFPEGRMREHWGYARLENTEDSPNLYLHQIRYYRMYQYFSDAFPDMFDPETRVLNIGDTSGLLYRAMGRTGLSLNIRPDRVAYMQLQGLDAVVGDAEALEFEDDSFDYVLCFQTLEHVKSPLKILSEMGRVARKAVFISIPFVKETRIWDREAFIRDYRQADPVEAMNITDDECHIFEFSSEDLQRLLSFTELTCADNFTLDYFPANGRETLTRRLVTRLTPSYFNFFVLEKRSNPEHA